MTLNISLEHQHEHFIGFCHNTNQEIAIKNYNTTMKIVSLITIALSSVQAVRSTVCL